MKQELLSGGVTKQESPRNQRESIDYFDELHEWPEIG
jgi:hypothetical protein